MKQLILGLPAIVVLGTSLAWGQAVGTPKIQFNTTVYDFGKTSLVQRVAGTFYFTNVGTKVLNLQRPTTTCGCTVANLTSQTLQPGESGALSFTLNVGPYKQTLQKYITVQSDDPQTPQVNLTLKCEYAPVYEVMPQMLYLDNLRLGSITNTGVQLKRSDGKPLVVSKVLATDPWIEAKFVPDPANPIVQSGRIAITIKPEGAARRFYDNLKVFGESTNETIATFYVSGRSVGDVACMPETLFWSLSGPLATNFTGSLTNINMTNLVTRRVVITSTRPNQPVEISKISSSIPELQTQLTPRADKHSYELVARLSGLPQTNRGTIMMETDSTTQPLVQIPVTVHVIKR